MLRRVSLAFLTAIIGCTSATTEPVGTRTVLAVFAARPTAGDLSNLNDIGMSSSQFVLPLNAIKIRTVADTNDIRAVAGVVRVSDHGTDDNPWVSVFITVADAVTAADISFVVNTGTLGPPGTIGTQVIAAIVRLDSVNRLATRSRFSSFELGADDSTTGLN